MTDSVNTTPTSDPTNPDPAKLTPEAVIAQLRAIGSQINVVEPLSKEQRQQIRRRVRALTKPVVEASINVIGVLDNVSQAIGQPLDEIRELQDESLRWDAAIEEARAFVKGLEGANLGRRQRLALIAAQAYTIGSQLAKDPAKSVLVPHLEEVRRLKSAARRRKGARAPQPPEPQTPPVPDPSKPKA
jgi:hypothetical protein